MPSFEDLVNQIPDEEVTREESSEEDGTSLDEDPADVPSHLEDLSELSLLLEQATAASAEEKRLKQCRKRLVAVQRHNHPDAEAETAKLLAEILRLEEKRIWTTIGCVALFYTQECSTCSSKHEFFVGWFTVRTHATDKHLRDMRLGEPTEPLPRWIERENRGKVAVCANCCESQIAIDIAAGKYPEAV